MRTLSMLTAVMMLVASVATAGPIADAATKAAEAAARAPTAPGNRSHKRTVTLLVSGASLVAAGAWALTQPKTRQGVPTDSPLECGPHPNDWGKNDAWKTATEVLCFGAGASFLVWGMSTLRRQHAAMMQRYRDDHGQLPPEMPRRLALSRRFRPVMSLTLLTLLTITQK